MLHPGSSPRSHSHTSEQWESESRQSGLSVDRQLLESQMRYTHRDHNVDGLPLHTSQNSFTYTYDHRAGHTDVVDGVQDMTNEQRFRMKTTDIALWFETLDGDQRQYVLGSLIQRCNRDDEAFISAIFERRGWTCTDPTRILERPLCVRIMQYLDPRSLCRAAQVSWSWHTICTSDAIWKPKCLRMGWRIPYVPSKLEKEAWSNFYAQCVRSWKAEASAAAAALAPPPQAPKSKIVARYGLDILDDDEEQVAQSMYSAHSSIDDQSSSHADISVGHTVLRRHDRDQEIRRQMLLRQSEAYLPHTKESQPFLEDTTNMNQANSFAASAFHGLKTMLNRRLNSWQQQGARLPRARSHVVINQPGDKDGHQASTRRAQTQKIEVPRGHHDNKLYTHRSSHAHPMSRAHPLGETDIHVPKPSEAEGNDINPRIIFISSNMEARALLLDAVRFDVVAIPYEASGCDLGALLGRLLRVLRGRTARSVAFICDGKPGFLTLGCGNARISLNSLAGSDNELNKDQAKFFRQVASHMLPSSAGGRLDLFTNSLLENVHGVDLIAILEHIMEVPVHTPKLAASTFQSCTWIRETYTSAVGTSSTRLYMDDAKLLIWHNVLDVDLRPVVSAVQDALASQTRLVQSTVAHQFISEIFSSVIFHTWSLESHQILEAIESAVLEMQKVNPSDPISFIGDHIIKKSKSRSTEESTAESTLGTDNDADDEDLWRPIDEDASDEIQKQIEKLKEVSDFDAFLKSEEHFVETLKAIQSVYAIPLSNEIKRANKFSSLENRILPPINTLSHRMLFMDVTNLLKEHEEFLEQLRGLSAGRDTDHAIACGILRLFTESRSHKEHLDNIQQSLSTLEDCAFKSERFCTFLTHRRIRHKAFGATLAELLQRPLQRLQFYRRYLVIVTRSRKSKGESNVFENALNNVVQLCKQMDQIRWMTVDLDHGLFLPEPLASVCKDDIAGRLICFMKMIQVKSTQGQMKQRFARIQDIVIVIATDVILLFKLIEYWHELRGSIYMRVSLLDKIETQSVQASILPDDTGARHIIKVDGGGIEEPYFLSSPCKESQLEVYHGIQCALDPLYGKWQEENEEDNQNVPVTIFTDAPQRSVYSAGKRWWMT